MWLSVMTSLINFYFEVEVCLERTVWSLRRLFRMYGLELRSSEETRNLWRDVLKREVRGKSVKAFYRDLRFNHYDNLIKQWVNDSPPVGMLTAYRLIAL